MLSTKLNHVSSVAVQYLQVRYDGVYEDEDHVVGVAGADVGGDLAELHAGHRRRLCRMDGHGTSA